MRLLPWIQEAVRREPIALEHYTDCELCMQRNTLTTRQFLGCGYAPKRAGVPSVPWSPAGYKGKAPEVCPGYTTRLPEVVEVARIRFHWDKGALDAACGGTATEQTLLGIELLSGAVSELSEWRMTPAKDGGGGS